MMGYGWFFQLLLLLLLLFIFWWLLRSGQQGYAVSSRERPLEVLQRRYASGELSRKEYLRLKRDLEEGS